MTDLEEILDLAANSGYHSPLVIALTKIIKIQTDALNKLSESCCMMDGYVKEVLKEVHQVAEEAMK